MAGYYPRPFTAVLSLPADIRVRGANSEMECYYWHGETTSAAIAGQRAQQDACEAYGVTMDKAPSFTVLFVFAGFHRDQYYTEKRKAGL